MFAHRNIKKTLYWTSYALALALAAPIAWGLFAIKDFFAGADKLYGDFLIVIASVVCLFFFKKIIYSARFARLNKKYPDFFVQPYGRIFYYLNGEKGAVEWKVDPDDLRFSDLKIPLMFFPVLDSVSFEFSFFGVSKASAFVSYKLNGGINVLLALYGSPEKFKENLIKEARWSIGLAIAEVFYLDSEKIRIKPELSSSFKEGCINVSAFLSDYFKRFLDKKLEGHSLMEINEAWCDLVGAEKNGLLE